MCVQKRTLRSGGHGAACSAGSTRFCLDGSRMNLVMFGTREAETSRVSTRTSREDAEPSQGNMLDMMDSALGMQGDTFIHAASMDTRPLAEGTETPRPCC